MPIPALDIKHVDYGNILNQAADTKMRNTQNALATEQLSEFKQNAPAKQAASARAISIQEMDMTSKQLDLAKKTTDAMKNELVSIGPEKYPEFLQKWEKVGVDVSGFPSPKTIGNDPMKWRAFQRQAITTADSLNKELELKTQNIQAQDVEKIKQKGQEDREKIKQKGYTDRRKLDATTSKPTGDLAYFTAIIGRLPKDPAEFKKFRLAIKDEKGMSSELKDIKKDYMQAIGRSNSAKRGVGQFVPDPNSAKVADQEMARANELADLYKKSGGKLSQLGIEENTPEDTPQIEEGTVIYNEKTGEEMEWREGNWKPL
jgi:hypothetical protein